jgi:hypothetical protein
LLPRLAGPDKGFAIPTRALGLSRVLGVRSLFQVPHFTEGYVEDGKAGKNMGWSLKKNYTPLHSPNLC